MSLHRKPSRGEGASHSAALNFPHPPLSSSNTWQTCSMSCIISSLNFQKNSSKSHDRLFLFLFLITSRARESRRTSFQTNIESHTALYRESRSAIESIVSTAFLSAVYSSIRAGTRFEFLKVTCTCWKALLRIRLIQLPPGSAARFVTVCISHSLTHSWKKDKDIREVSWERRRAKSLGSTSL